ncbi:retron St85 family RNA-directed DNA polymerase [Xanthomonas bundabergensis]|uniref:retron St85 family RNA-directed DNA polymerase n=1 Tax=Xanthomonas bundabergensis TaxID=3160842 RepID=UPI003516AAD0
MTGLVSKISSLIGISTSSCRVIARGAYRRYKIFNIPKKNGDRRVVAQPAREVKAVQRAICHLLSKEIEIHQAATAYKPGSSILRNADIHKGAKYLTKLDFSDFFSSIDEESIVHLLQEKCTHLSVSELKFIVDACTWRPTGKPVLCIGAPSSPFFANAVMFEFDEKVSVLARFLNARYTRYSDDIAISSSDPDVLSELENGIRQLVEKSRLPTVKFNEKKRIAVSRSTSMTVTGLTLTNQGGVSVGRERKRGVRAGVFRFLSGQLNDIEAERLKGEIAFVLSIEPSFRGVLINTYGMRAWSLLPKIRQD